jgi:TonB-linked SusC/RagA family outer membrane protein
MKNNYLFRCTMLAGLLSAGVVYAVTPASIAVGASSFPIAQSVSEEKITITGTVTDENGEPLIGVSIQVKGTSKGTITDVNGKYTLSLSPGATISFSYVGMKPMQRKVTKGGQLNVSMQNDAKMLDEVVAIGYGTMKRGDLTGSVVSVNAKAIEESMASTIDQALQGRAAGLQMTQNSGVPGGGTSIQIRGVNSLNSTNEPIYVVDGVIISGETGSNTSNAIAGINPADIESIEILKDASATAIYGAQAANGVILISMKAGVSGKPRVNFQASAGVQELPNKIDMMDLRGYARHYNELYALLDASKVKDAFSHPETLGSGTDWQDEIFRKALLQNYNISVRGGTKTVTYNISGGYTGQDGICIGSDFERYTFRMATEIQATSKVRFGGTVNVSYTKQSTGMASWSIIPNALYQAPDVPVRDNGGNFTGPSDNDQEFLSSYSNPVALASLTQRNNEKGGVRANLFMKINPVKWLTYRTDFTADGSLDNYQYFLPQYELGWSKNPYSTNEHSKNYGLYWGWKNVLTMDKTFARKHKVSWMLGHEMTSRKSDYLQGKRTHGDALLTDLDAGDAVYATNSGRGSKTTYLSFFSRLFYSYNNRYQMTATIRRDGTSNFAKGNQWGTFPSVALAWRVSEERFWRPLKDVINNLKFRVSYGEVGNSNVSSFAYQRMGNFVQSIWGNSIQTANIANPDLTWESTRSWNAGLDLNLFNNRVEFIFDAYIKKTKDLLLQQDFPGYVGTTGTGAATAQWANIGSMQNKGFEFTLNTVNISNRDFQWRTNVTFSLNRNKVVAMNTENAFIDKTYQQSGETNVITRTAIGHPVSQFYGYKVIGRINTASDYLIDNGDGTSTVKIATPVLRTGDCVVNAGTDKGSLVKQVYIGDYIFEDVNNDGIIDEKDQTFLGSPLPKFTYGINNTFKYKNFDLSIFLYGSQGNKAMNYLSRRLKNPNSSGNVHQEVNNYARLGYIDGNSANNNVWNICILPGANPSQPRMSVNDANDNDRISNRIVEDASFLRIQNIVFGYTLPKSWLRKLKIENARVYANIKNVYTFTGYSGYDPEIGSTQAQYSYSGQSMLMYGVDTGRCPSPRIYTFGIDLTF